jgi:predicted aminopeptidase
MLRLVALLVFGLAGSGCFTTHYLWQAAGGQLDIMGRSRPIELVVQDPRTPARTAELLSAVPSIKRFGEGYGLTPTRNYQDYSDLGRAEAVWVVSACAPLSFRSLEWEFPVVGRVPYLGWFDTNEAREFALKLKRAGWDVEMRGASAYSTLGWFDDPIVSTMLSHGDEGLGELANVVLHESVHATVFLPGLADLNESLASFVADKLTRAYLVEARGEGSVEATAYAEAERGAAERHRLMHEAYEALDAVYRSAGSRADKRTSKSRIMGELSSSIGASRDINNATLAQFRTYNGTMPELDALHAACGHSFPRFFAALRTLPRQETTAAQLKRAIQELSRRGCRS